MDEQNVLRLARAGLIAGSSHMADRPRPTGRRALEANPRLRLASRRDNVSSGPGCERDLHTVAGLPLGCARQCTAAPLHGIAPLRLVPPAA